MGQGISRPGSGWQRGGRTRSCHGREASTSASNLSRPSCRRDRVPAGGNVQRDSVTLGTSNACSERSSIYPDTGFSVMRIRSGVLARPTRRRRGGLGSPSWRRSEAAAGIASGDRAIRRRLPVPCNLGWSRQRPAPRPLSEIEEEGEQTFSLEKKKRKRGAGTGQARGAVGPSPGSARPADRGERGMGSASEFSSSVGGSESRRACGSGRRRRTYHRSLLHLARRPVLCLHRARRFGSRRRRRGQHRRWCHPSSPP